MIGKGAGTAVGFLTLLAVRMQTDGVKQFCTQLLDGITVEEANQKE